jgi:hypothetical protein
MEELWPELKNLEPWPDLKPWGDELANMPTWEEIMAEKPPLKGQKRG